jgi:hypothetical protein
MGFLLGSNFWFGGPHGLAEAILPRRSYQGQAHFGIWYARNALVKGRLWTEVPKTTVT